MKNKIVLLATITAMTYSCMASAALATADRVLKDCTIQSAEANVNAPSYFFKATTGSTGVTTLENAAFSPSIDFRFTLIDAGEIDASNEFYFIVSAKNGDCLTASNGLVVTTTCANTNSQKWVVSNGFNPYPSFYTLALGGNGADNWRQSGSYAPSGRITATTSTTKDLWSSFKISCKNLDGSGASPI